MIFSHRTLTVLSLTLIRPILAIPVDTPPKKPLTAVEDLQCTTNLAPPPHYPVSQGICDGAIGKIAALGPGQHELPYGSTFNWPSDNTGCNVGVIANVPMGQSARLSTDDILEAVFTMFRDCAANLGGTAYVANKQARLYLFNHRPLGEGTEEKVVPAKEGPNTDPAASTLSNA